MEDVIKTQNLTKSFGDVYAVKNVSLNVGKGEIYGFLGLNGAGKTTTIRMLLGMIRPSTGSSFVLGKKVSANSHDLWRKVGYLVETPSSYPELTVWENLEIMRRLHQISDEQAVEKIIGKLRLTAYKNRKAGHLSLGNAQRLGLAKAFMHNPEILILDEPTNGLDPAGIVEIRELLEDLVPNHGTTVFVSSHILGEISRIATRIGIIHEGQLLQEINADTLEQLLQKRLVIDAKDKKIVQARLTKEGYIVNSAKNGVLEITDEKAVKHPEDIATLLVHANLPPTLLKIEEEDLESYFLRIIKGNVK